MKRFWWGATVAVLAVAAVPGIAMAPAAKPAVSKPTTRTAPPAPAAARLTGATLGPTLRALGYSPLAADGHQRLRIEEEKYGYRVDLSISPKGDWLLGTAYLSPIPDLTKVPPGPLMSLLATNDSLVGMSFGYNREESRLVLNATIPTRGMDPGSLKNLIEGMKETIRRSDGLWDASKW